MKREIRIAAEKEELEFYLHKAPQEWLDDQCPCQTVRDASTFAEAERSARWVPTHRSLAYGVAFTHRIRLPIQPAGERSALSS
jgi:hypothetical protein